MSAITISRQLGSLGDEIAGLLAQELGCTLCCRQLINAAAIRAGAPEMALAEIDELGLLGVQPKIRERQAYFQAIRQIMEEHANQGPAVIIGRGGVAVLRQRPDVLHVRIVAPIMLRAERIAGKLRISVKAAQAQIEASDRIRKVYLKRNYGIDWEDSSLFDLTLNTARLDPANGAAIVLHAYQHIIHRSKNPDGAFKELHLE